MKINKEIKVPNDEKKTFFGETYGVKIMKTNKKSKTIHPTGP